MSQGSGRNPRRTEAPLDDVARLHATPHRTVYAFAGAGSLALAWLHAVGGSSRTVLEAHDHYHAASLRDALGAEPDASVSPRVAEGLAVASRTRARSLVADDDPPGPTFGLGLTATIATDRRKRGEHRVELASADALGVAGTSFVLAKGARDRAGEEEIVGRWLLASAAEASGLLGWAGPSLRNDEPVAHRFRPSSAFQAFLDDSDALLALGATGRPIPIPEDGPAPALVSGSFHPMHEGHRRLADAAEAHLGRPAWFEMALANADKDAVAPVEARRRAAQAYGVRRLLLTHAPLFAEKAERLPGCVFVVGVDTARRVLAPRFYGGEDGLASALARVRAAGARFLVAGRAGEEGFRTLGDLDVPAPFGDLFEALPSFRVDLSSTELRADWPSTADL
jgi:hypothetical protein